MNAGWITSSSGLPHEGQQIEFKLDCRSVAMEGTYTGQWFRSHWAGYTVDRVRSWRDLDQQPELATPALDRSVRDPSSTPHRDTSDYPLPSGSVVHAG